MYRYTMKMSGNSHQKQEVAKIKKKKGKKYMASIDT